MSSDTGLYFAQFPKNFDKLGAVLVTVKDGAASGRDWRGPRQFYREIIFTEPNLLIAPESEENVESEKAVIIAENHVLEHAKLGCLLNKFSLEPKASIPVTRSLFLYCFEFVLSHRLAPFWNKIDKFFLKGRDFLAEQSKICAIQSEFSLTDKITLAMKAQLIKLPKPKVEDFGISPNILQKFYQSNDFVINGYSLENNKCLVLPSLKTGYISSIAHFHLEDINFKQYWKVMYGFRLPTTPEQDVFYNVRFPMSDKTFSYPACCIRHHEPQVSIRCDQKAIFKSFLEDFALRMPSVCGCPLTFTSSTLYPTNSLHLASISKQSNLTRKPSLSKASQPFTFTMKKSLEVESTCSKVSNINNKVTSHGNFENENVFKKASNINENEKRNDISIVQLRHGDNTSLENAQADVNILCNTSRIQPYVPCFTKHNAIQNLSKKKLLNVVKERKEKSVVPCFKKRLSKSQLNGLKAHANCASSGISKQDKMLSSSNVGERSVDSGLISSNTSLVTKARSDPLRLSLNKTPVLSNCRNSLQCSSRNTTNDASQTVNRSEITQPTKKGINFHVMAEDGKPSLQTDYQPIAKQSTKLAKNVKKANTYVDVDVRKMVAENKLSKVSAAAITKWLKSEGVKCKCKEKKQELIVKVYQYLGLVQPE